MKHRLKALHMLETPWGMIMYGFKCAHCGTDFYYEVDRVRELVTGVPSYLDGVEIQKLWKIGRCNGQR